MPKSIDFVEELLVTVENRLDKDLGTASAKLAKTVCAGTFTKKRADATFLALVNKATKADRLAPYSIPSSQKLEAARELTAEFVEDVENFKLGDIRWAGRLHPKAVAVLKKSSCKL